MYILLMIVFSQPYGVEYLHNIGEYPTEQICTEERNRAINIFNESKYSYTAFGCVPVSLKNKPKYSNVSRETKEAK